MDIQSVNIKVSNKPFFFNMVKYVGNLLLKLSILALQRMNFINF